MRFRAKPLAVLVALILLLLGGFGLRYYWTHRYDKLIQEQARKRGLDPALVKAIIYEESFFNPYAASQAGALGLMQVTPIALKEWLEAGGYKSETEAFAREFDRVSWKNRTGIEARDLLYQPEINLSIGCWYLKHLLKRYEDEKEPLPIALAGYNAGPTHASRWNRPGADGKPLTTEEFIKQIDFPQTREYVQKILNRYQQYRREEFELQSTARN